MKSITLSHLIFLIFLILLFLFPCIVNAYTKFERIDAKPVEHLSREDANFMIEQLIEESKHTSLPILQVNTIFFLRYRKDRKDMKNIENALLVLVEQEGENKTHDFYLITKEKTYIVTYLLDEVRESFQFIYYISNKVDFDMKGVSVFGLEEVVQNNPYNLIDKIIYSYIRI